MSFKLNVPDNATKVLLHACCAPCSSAIVECMIENGIRPTIFYCNPNIYPQSEYQIRKDECTRFAENLGLDIIDDDYNHDQWLLTAQPLADEPERGQRCLTCFKHRLLRTAQYAAANGFQVFTTTLASSRWKHRRDGKASTKLMRPANGPPRKLAASLSGTRTGAKAA